MSNPFFLFFLFDATLAHCIQEWEDTISPGLRGTAWKAKVGAIEQIGQATLSGDVPDNNSNAVCDKTKIIQSKKFDHWLTSCKIAQLASR